MCLLHVVSYSVPDSIFTLMSVSVSTIRVSLIYTQMPTRSKATCEVTGVCCPELCDHRGCVPSVISRITVATGAPLPQRRNIISLHMRQSAHTAGDRSAVSTHANQ